jgi:hypothetical protein
MNPDRVWEESTPNAHTNARTKATAHNMFHLSPSLTMIFRPIARMSPAAVTRDTRGGHVDRLPGCVVTLSMNGILACSPGPASA